MSAGYVHGDADAREALRLEKQAGFVWPKVAAHFVAHPGERVLDLATGVGAMAGQLHRAHPGVELYGVDLRPGQLHFAKANHPEALYVNADGARLPFADGTFHRVHCSWLLEHVSAEAARRILAEVHRVLAPAGTAHLIEVDNGSFRITPEDEVVTWAMEALNRAQVEGGGDPFVGGKLQGYLQEAGFTEVKVVPSALEGSLADLPGFVAMVEEFAEIFESLDEALGPQAVPRLHEAAARLRALPQRPGARFDYAGALAVAKR